MRPLALALLATATLAAADAPPRRDAIEAQPRDGLANIAARLQAGQEVRIAYFGGSITEAEGWRVKSYAWLKQQYPTAKLTEIHAAIGGTGSDLGAYRCGQDVLRHKPDLVFVEFAVNDDGRDAQTVQRNMEGIVRQVWSADARTDLCFVYTLTQKRLPELQTGKLQPSAAAMEALADHYGIPSLCFGVEVAAREKAGSLVFKGVKPKTDEEKAALGTKVLFSEDGVHPLDAGHAIYQEVFARSWPKLAAAGRPGPHVLKPAFIAGNAEHAQLLPADRATLSAGWQKLDPATDPLAKRFAHRTSALYRTTTPGDTLTFAFSGTAFGLYVLYGPDGGQISVAIDGGKPRTVTLMDGYCTYYRLSTNLSGGLADGPHTAVCTFEATRPDRKAILFPANQADLEKNPAKYAGLAWHVAGILVDGATTR